MADLRTSVVIDLRGNLARKARRDTQALERMGRRGSRAMRVLRGTTERLKRSIGSLGGRFTALAGAVAGVAGAKVVIDFDARLASIGARAGKTGKDLDAFVKDTKKRFFDLANLPQFNISPDEVLAAVDEIITKTGNLKFALEQLPNIALLIRGGEARGQDAGSLIANLFQKLDIKTVKQMTGVLGDLTAQGDKGAFEIGDLATQGERLTAALAKTGRTGPIAVREMGAILQMFKRTTGTTEMATTAFERFIDTITSEKAKELRKAGIQIFDEEKLAEGLNVLRSPIAILRDILLKADKIAAREGIGINEVLTEIFDIRAGRGVAAFTVELQKAKSRGEPEAAFAAVESFLRLQGGEALLRRRARDLARRPAAKVERGKTVLKQASEAVLGRAINRTSAFIDAVQEDRGIEFLKKLDDQRIEARTARLDAEEALEFTTRRLAEAREAQRIEGKITVEFENAPPGTRIKELQIKPAGVELEADAGQLLPGN